MAGRDARWSLNGQVLTLRGVWTADAVARELPLLPQSEICCVDLSGVQRLDSALMTVLLAMRARVPGVRLLHVPPHVQGLMTLYGLDEWFDFSSGAGA